MFVSLLLLIGMVPVSSAQDHLLITEFVVTPTAGEFIEIYNGTGAAVDLTDYYITDDVSNNNNDYINLVDGTAAPASSDFLVRFPAGATIEAGDYLVIAVDGAAFNSTYDLDADYEIKGTSETTPDMLSPGTGYIGASVTISNAGEVIILYYWDGTSDLVQDVDIVVWGDKVEAVDKTGVTKGSSTYLNDTPVADQISVSNDTPHGSGKSMARASLAEADETTSGGNGITGHDETSENLAKAFTETDPTPGKETANYVSVTFICNTAAWQDTVGANSLVQLRGTTITEAGQSADDASVDTLSPGTIINWGALGTMYLENVEGDYWKSTFRLPAGTKMAYKLFVNAAHDTVYPGVDWEHAGWESNIATTPGIYPGNRGLDLSNFAGTDTTLPVQFANGWKGELENQYETPYETNDSTFVFYVRVNMLGWEDFDPGAHVVGVRGSNMSDWGQTGELSWGETYPLTQENTDGMGRYFYSGAVHVPNQYADAGVKFKFVVHNAGNPLNEDWGDMVYNPGAEYENTTAGNDTTIYWRWFDNLVPRVAEHPDQIVVNYIVDVRDAVADRGFTLGDTLQVRTGYGQTADQRYDLYLQRQGVGTVYAGKDTIFSMIGRELFYQYYSEVGGTVYREVYFNFQYPDPSDPIAERRAITPDAAEITIADTLSSVSESRRMPKFRNVQVIAQDSIVVTLTCDVRPAIYQVLAGDVLNDIQGQVDVTDADSVLAWGVAVNGPLTGGWSSPGGDWGRHLMSIANKAMHDDGLNGDAAEGDSIFSIQFTMYKDSSTQANGPTNIIGQEFKFGIGGGDNEGGYGNNHIVNVDDAQDSYVIAAQFGSIDPVFYSAWDFDKRGPATGVEYTELTALPNKFTLEPNFPNPFNPVTRIKYSLAKHERVILTVYNVLGEKVATLVDKKQQTGSYEVSWNGQDSIGRMVGSGVYFYKIEAGDFVKTHKMMLLR